MTELEIMQRAKMYMDKLANGINPLNDAPVPEWETLNNVRLCRCFFYVSDVLRRVIRPVRKPCNRRQKALSSERVIKDE